MSSKETTTYTRSLFTQAIHLQRTNPSNLRSVIPHPTTRLTTALYRTFSSSEKVIMAT
ncbi:hypothetical protein L13192_12459 [Pyrenophora tritici-repentis]|uniref:Uncharacterized protein n=2 Tax=Pyrenophora tritici-repentis TaxID=45151 RepID=A0A922NK93_9PLEO|nr:uncharacterized protein PTRG_08104 [Pyrenophora tritici-repentis Pt-1C-BFP]EDU51023.1 predicted protein [Pyrenophora tritici-repentis Pt-1C-BFP]KAI1515829.1 hypothetical protein Ptr86124_005830 [Pyrenophora tritici-repentis]KAI1663504.1 hypothetical protein L13192_12459 [Pyrenophora tritici-repentis]KAI1684460.1 hypothetical protein KJE20_06965 [Pyrenophora tritici-repentis]